MIDKISDHYGKDAEVHLIVKKGLEDLFKHDKRVRSIIAFDKRASQKGLLGLLKTIKKTRKLKLDVLFNVHRSLRSGIVTVLSGARVKIGFTEAVLSFLFTKRVKREGAHEVIKNHALLEAYDPYFKKVRPETRTRYKLFTAPTKDSLEPFIVIAPGSKWHTKRWTKDGYIKITEKLLRTYNHDIIFAGDRNDEHLIRDIISTVKTDHAKNRITNLAGKLDIPGLMSLLSKASLVITNDSAPQHLAVGFDVPVVAIFGPTVRSLGYYPFSENSAVVEAFEVKCRPCGLHGHMKCPRKTNECMTAIKPDMVMHAIQKFL
jgi:heptosyltransferase II